MSTRTIILCTILFITIFSQVQAGDLPYKPSELLIRFAPKANGQQLTEVEQNDVLALLGAGENPFQYRLFS